MTCPKLHSVLETDCTFDFKIGTQFINTSVPVDPADPKVLADCVNTLNLCEDTVLFKNVKCAKGLGSIILGVPLKWVDGCQQYTIRVPEIPGGDTDLNVVVEETNTGTTLPVNFQVANGYLYVEINITDDNGGGDQNYFVFGGDDAPSLELCFKAFTFDLNKKYVGCRCPPKCLPVIWLCGRNLGALVQN